MDGNSVHSSPPHLPPGGTEAVYFPTMAPRFDPGSLRLDLSVPDLLESPFLRSLGFSSRGGYERLWLGQAIHGRYQEQKLAEDPSYRREVVVSHVFEHCAKRLPSFSSAPTRSRTPEKKIGAPCTSIRASSLSVIGV